MILELMIAPIQSVMLCGHPILTHTSVWNILLVSDFPQKFEVRWLIIVKTFNMSYQDKISGVSLRLFVHLFSDYLLGLKGLWFHPSPKEVAMDISTLQPVRHLNFFQIDHRWENRSLFL